MRDLYTYDVGNIKGIETVNIRLTKIEDDPTDTFPTIRSIIDTVVSYGFAKKNIYLSTHALQTYMKGLY
jgi:hypothetical protein